MFRFNNMGFKYDNWIFENVTCEINDKRVGIIGDNGIGKTTLLHLLNRDLVPECGSIALDCDTYLVDFSMKNYMNLTSNEIISLCSVLNSFDDSFEELSEVLMFKGYLDVCLNKLSQGSLKKFFLMLGLSAKQKIVLLDEPFDNLDQATNQNLTKYISSCGKELVIVSHNIDILRSCVDAIYKVSDRTLVKQ